VSPLGGHVHCTSFPLLIQWYITLLHVWEKNVSFLHWTAGAATHQHVGHPVCWAHMSGNDCTYCPGCLFEVGPTPKKKTIQYCIFCLDKNVDAFVAYYRTIILEHHNILRTVGLLPLVVIRHMSCVFIYIFGTMQAVVCDFR
jgi:hypothetical protein